MPFRPCVNVLSIYLCVFALDICYVNKLEVFFVGVSTTASVNVELRVYITFCGCLLDLNPSDSSTPTALKNFDYLTMITLYHCYDWYCNTEKNMSIDF